MWAPHPSVAEDSCPELSSQCWSWPSAAACTTAAARGTAQVLESSIRIRPPPATPPARRPLTNGAAAANLHLERRQPDVPSGSKLRDRHRSDRRQLHQLVLVPTILHGAAQHVHHGLGLVERRRELQLEL